REAAFPVSAGRRPPAPAARGPRSPGALWRALSLGRAAAETTNGAAPENPSSLPRHAGALATPPPTQQPPAAGGPGAAPQPAPGAMPTPEPAAPQAGGSGAPACSVKSFNMTMDD